MRLPKSIVLVAFLLVSCSTRESGEIEIAKDRSFLEPAIENADIKFEEYSVRAEKGDTLFTRSGSILLFRENSFVDSDGEIVEGEVDVVYRDFNTPLDFFLAGVPMEYDSGGISYDFESSAMMEIYAYKEGEPLFVNPNNPPEVFLGTMNDDNSHNLYFLDEERGEWIAKGKDVITDTDADPESETNELESLPVLPIEPEKASGEYPTIGIIIEQGSRPELQVYDNLEFEIDPEEQNYDPIDAKTLWESVDIEESSVQGKYIVTFRKGDKVVSLLTRPVFSGASYNEAYKIFETQKAKYDQARALRVQKERTIEKEVENIRRINELVEARNKEIGRENKRIAQENERIAQENKRIAQKNERTIRENERFQREKRIYRSFKLDGFGLWNCDIPLFRQGVELIAHFLDSNGEQVTLRGISVVYTELNGIIRFKDARLNIALGNEFMLWAIVENRLAIYRSSDFADHKIDADTREFSFPISIIDQDIESVDDVRTLIYGPRK